MKLTQRLAAMNRLQKTTRFKVIASIVIGVIAMGLSVWWATDYLSRDRIDTGSFEDALAQIETEEQRELTEEELELFRVYYEKERSWDAFYNQLGASPTDIPAAIGIGAALTLAMVWTGLGLTSLAYAFVLGGVAAPLYLLGRFMGTHWDTGGWLTSLALFITAVGILGYCFSIFLELFKLLLGGTSPVMAVARNVVNEAVRMKVSLVFIVLLIVALAVLPGMLNADTPLRYRLQAFLQYATGGTFWLLAIMVLFLSVGTVAFEQRDRIIWQTITKPIGAWGYILGKWLGVVSVAAALLGVSAAGVYTFTVYMNRTQVAVGEAAPFVPIDQTKSITEDRLAVQSQVLAARTVVRPQFPEIDQEELYAEAARRLEQANSVDPVTYPKTQEMLEQLANQIRQQVLSEFRAVSPPRPEQGQQGQIKTYVFRSLDLDAVRGKALTLRYKIHVGGDDPRQRYSLGFQFLGDKMYQREANLNARMVIEVPPGLVYSEKELGLENARAGKGAVVVSVVNAGLIGNPAESDVMTFAEDGLQLYIPAGSFIGNYARVTSVLWLKLAMLAMLGVTASTFLSFSVSCLVSFGIFLMAQSAAFMNRSLQYYSVTDHDNNVVIWKLIAQRVSSLVSDSLQFYANLKPIDALIEGRLLSWGTVAYAVAIFGIIIAALYATGAFIFKRRELAMYSGQ